MHPQLYVKSCEQPVRDFKYILSVYSKLLKFDSYNKVLDVGCGPGNVTVELLIPYLSRNLQKLLGVDVSSEMIEYAKNRYGALPNLDFQILDITSSNLPQNLQNEFDLVTSFYCLQIIADLRGAFQNMYTLLRPGGDLFVFFMGDCFPLDIWCNLAKTTKWGKYMKNYKDKMCPVHSSQNQVDFVKNLLSEVGFEVHVCTSTKREMVYYRELLQGLLKAIIHFDIPKDLEDDFILDHLNEFRAYNFTRLDENNTEQFVYSYTLITVYASKPFSN